ncbi:MAG: hypothetical protein R3261_04365 [Alphaproteobacteria bacterium]|nr:hypothetical protein [Alphaproteobacteria bacterium]
MNLSIKDEDLEAAEDRQSPDMRRRFILVTEENPNLSIDYLISLSGKLNDEESAIRITYVPDKLLLSPDAFEHYLHSFEDDLLAAPERLALAILDDFNNELVPRWVQVQVQFHSSNHQILIEDRQPIWDNAGLLARLQKF